MPHSGAITNDAVNELPTAETPAKRVTRSAAFVTPPEQTIAPRRSPPGAPVRPVRKIVLG